MRFKVPFPLLIILIALTATPLSADTTITYQGQLQDASGPYTGTPGMIFRLYDSLTGDNQIGGDVVLENVPVTDGLFQAELDFGEVFDGERWLEVVVDGNVLDPRQRIAPAPVALQALNVPEGEDTLAELDCASGQIPKWDGSTWACAEDEDSTYLPGDGLQLSGTIFDLRTEFTDELYWRQGGNAGTDPASDFLGTSDKVPFEIHVDSQRAWKIEPTVYENQSGDSFSSANLIGGAAANEILDGAAGVTIAGGGMTDWPNSVSADFGTIGGGLYNIAGGSIASTVAGGVGNFAIGGSATVGGGGENAASGEASTVPGGRFNEAGGDYSLAAGRRAKSEHDGAFVWADDTNADFASTGEKQFVIRAGGGMGINTNDPDAPLHVAPGRNSDLVSTEGDFKVGSNAYRFKLAVAGIEAGSDAGSVYLRSQGGTHRLILGSNESDVLVIHDEDGADPGVDNQYSLGSSSSRWTSVWATSGTVNSSDRRLKTNVVDYDGALATLQSLRPVTYQWKHHPQLLARPGLIAQEVREILPEIVEEPADEEGKLGIRYAELIPIVIAALQEQNKAASDHFDQLAAENLELRERLAAVESDNAQLYRKVSRLATEREEVAELENRLAALESLLLEDRQVAGELE